MLTEQEHFWAGDFGHEYLNRNTSAQLLTAKIAMWSNILRSTHGVHSIQELGCNVGLNLLALKQLKPELKLSGIEINAEAVKQAASLNVAEIQQGTVLEKMSTPMVDLTFTAGVLIHINPDYLKQVYENLVSQSCRYIVIAEYYNPSRTSVTYRGHQDRLFKCDFSGELMDQYHLKLIDYGFIYHRDNWAPQDDITWFLMEK